MIRQRYEFDTEQNAIIAGLATRLTIIGAVCFLIGVGVLLMMFARTGNLLAMLIAGLAIAFGSLAIYAAQAFRKITTTQTRDMDHLVEALRTLNRVYNVQIAAILAGAIVVGYFVWNIWK
jgi:predicted lysophospholipase L1 biosynthesis ABC-type transport system permease subunit